MKIIYTFVKMGSVIDEQEENYLVCDVDKRHDEPGRIIEFPKNKTIFLDVGNRLQKGIVDHHHINGFKIMVMGKEYGSATGILSADLELIEHVRGQDEVIIVTHKEPDFDSIAAAYLAREYLINRELPEHSDKLVEYVEQVDSGKMKMVDKNYKVPFAIITAMHQTITSFGEDKDREVLERGMEFIDYLLDNLQRMTKAELSLGLYNPCLLEGNHNFTEELDFLKKDYNSYLKERDNQQICEKKTIRLPSRVDKSVKIEVDGLFWYKPPECLLHKYWARSDSESPRGEGFVFTFIPLFVDKENKEQKTCRVVISVDPSSQVYLKGLAELLEGMEVKKERKIFAADLSLWRSRTKQRFEEDWIDNEDPWYDGRGFDYTIVDVPRVGSLLNIAEIKEVVSYYNKPLIKKLDAVIIIPFTFSFEKDGFKSMDNTFSDKDCIEKINNPKAEFFNRIQTNNLEEYVNDYLFNNDVGKDSCNYTYHYNLKEDRVKEFLNIEKEEFQNVLFKKMRITLFKYGVGYISLYMSNKEDELRADHLLGFYNYLKNSNELFLMLAKIIDEGIQNKIKIGNMLFYSFVKVENNCFFDNDKQELLFKLCSGEKYNTPYLKESSNKLDDDFQMCEVDPNILYGLSKNGFCLLVSCIDESDEAFNYKVQKTKDDFLMIVFHVFILSLQQRDSLINFSHLLALYDRSKAKSKIANLRLKLIDFTIQGWFSEVTRNNIIGKLHKKWREILGLDHLFQEVQDQLSAIDEFNKTTIKNKIEILSVILLPLVVVDILTGQKFLQLFNIDIHWSLGFIIPAVVIVSLLLLIFSDSIKLRFRSRVQTTRRQFPVRRNI